MIRVCARGDSTMDESSIPGLMADVNSDLFEFLRDNVNSFAQWDLIHFFHEHPNDAQTAEDVARYARQETEAMQAELSELAGRGILAQRQVGGSSAYSLTKDAATRDLIDRLVQASADQRFRVGVIYYLIRAMR